MTTLLVPGELAVVVSICKCLNFEISNIVYMYITVDSFGTKCHFLIIVLT
jgi:hypothetical protein